MLTENQASQLFETAGLKGADFVELFFEDKEEIALTCTGLITLQVILRRL